MANVDKVWTELAYESVRGAIAPSAPSRLTSVFTCADVFEAFSFTEETGAGKFVYRAEADETARWQLVDMGAFSVAHPRSVDDDGYRTSWDEAIASAERYWLTGSATPNTPFMAEVLVEGAVVLTGDRLRLIDEMRRLALVED